MTTQRSEEESAGRDIKQGTVFARWKGFRAQEVGSCFRVVHPIGVTK